jgi:hypothetical protein
MGEQPGCERRCMDALAGLRTKQALMRKVIQASLVGIAALSVNAVADELKQLPRWDTAARYTIDSARTVVSFEVRSFGVLRHLGRFRKSFGSVSLDPQAHNVEPIGLHRGNDVVCTRINPWRPRASERVAGRQQHGHQRSAAQNQLRTHGARFSTVACPATAAIPVCVSAALTNPASTVTQPLSSMSRSA